VYLPYLYLRVPAVSGKCLDYGPITIANNEIWVYLPPIIGPLLMLDSPLGTGLDGYYLRPFYRNRRYKRRWEDEKIKLPPTLLRASLGVGLRLLLCWRFACPIGDATIGVPFDARN
jgi:hypothetical protein